jgi:hypothetical protein
MMLTIKLKLKVSVLPQRTLRKSLGLLHKGLTYLLLLVAMLFSACAKDLDIDLGNEGGKPVVYAFIQPDSAFSISLTQSVSILSGVNYQYFNNASIRVFKNGALNSVLNYPANSIHAQWPQLTFSNADTVRIEVWGGGEKITQTSTVVVPPVKIESVDTVRVLRKGADGVYIFMMRMSMVFSDPPSQKNFYQLALFNHKRFVSVGGLDSLVTDTVVFNKDDKLFYNAEQGSSGLEQIDFQGLFNDDAINGVQYKLYFYLPVEIFDPVNGLLDSRLEFRLYHLENMYYQFMRSRIIANSYVGLPIFNPVKAPSNIDGGFGVVTSLSHHSFFVDINGNN